MEKSCLKSGRALVIPDMVLVLVKLRALFKRSSYQNYSMRKPELVLCRKRKKVILSLDRLSKLEFSLLQSRTTFSISPGLGS